MERGDADADAGVREALRGVEEVHLKQVVSLPQIVLEGTRLGQALHERAGIGKNVGHRLERLDAQLRGDISIHEMQQRQPLTGLRLQSGGNLWQGIVHKHAGRLVDVVLSQDTAKLRKQLQQLPDRPIRLRSPQQALGEGAQAPELLGRRRARSCNVLHLLPERLDAVHAEVGRDLARRAVLKEVHHRLRTAEAPQLGPTLQRIRQTAGEDI